MTIRYDAQRYGEITVEGATVNGALVRPELLSALLENATPYEAEDGVGYGETVFDVRCVYTPGTPGRTYGPPENCYPDEPADVEYDVVCGGVSLTAAEVALFLGSERALRDSLIEEIEDDLDGRRDFDPCDRY